MLWFSSPTSLHQWFLNSGTIIEKYNEVIDLAIVATIRDWDVNRDEWPVLLPYDGDSEDDLSDE